MKKFISLLALLITSSYLYAYDFEVDGIFYNITSIENKTVEVTYSTDLNYQQNRVVIPSEVTWGNYNFTVKGIGTCAFDGFNYPNRVDTIIISKGIEYIGSLAFQSSNLKMIRIPNTIKNIGDNAFSPGNKHDQSIDWYVDDFEWLCTIGHHFSSYTIKNIYVNNVKLEGDIIISNGVPFISSIFNGFEWIKTLTIASSVSYITTYAFQNSKKMESVTFMEGVKRIGSVAFRNCTSLRNISLPNSLTCIDGEAFENCPALMDVQSYITEPFPTDGFTNGQYLSATLTVPHGTKAKYMAVDGWKNFANIQERDGCSYTIDLSVIGNGTLKMNEETLGDFIIADKNSNISIRCVPNEGYKLEKVTIDDIDITNNVINNVITIEGIKKNCKLEVTFAKIPISLTIQHAENGYLKQFVERGANIKFAIVPADGWKINTIVYNGYDVTSELNDDKEYTTPAINADAMLSISFESTQSAINSARITYAKVYGSNGEIVISGTGKGVAIYVYDDCGKIIAQTVANSTEQRIAIQAKGIYIVKVGGKTVKVCL